MTKKINLEEMEELNIDDYGEITLQGKVRKAKPLGSPIPVRSLRLPNEERFYCKQFLERELQANYNCPIGANAYIWGKPLDLPDVTIAGIQFYRINGGKIK